MSKNPNQKEIDKIKNRIARLEAQRFNFENDDYSEGLVDGKISALKDVVILLGGSNE